VFEYHQCSEGKTLMACVQRVTVGGPDSTGVWHWFKWRSFRRRGKGVHIA